MPRTGRTLLVASVFVAASLHGTVDLRHGDVGPLRSSLLDPFHRTQPRLGRIRPRGNKHELWGEFAALSDTDARPPPSTPREIARRYGIPETPRGAACVSNATTVVGWVPSELSARGNGNSSGIPRQGRIPRIIFQSWKTNRVKGRQCSLLMEWSAQNPDYDYFLFDDYAIDNFIRLEYGDEIFSAYACVAVGAAKCDVWRLLAVYLFGGVYFDADVRPFVPLSEWGWGDRDVVTAKSCTKAEKLHPGGCAHQWALIYAPRHPVLHAAIRETLANLADRSARTVYDVSFWSYYHAWRDGPYNQSYMPGWYEQMGGRVKFQDNGVKDDMKAANGHWQESRKIWYDKCM